ncbi:hypothetical protein [Tatumella ptyseos]|uniref:Uncharacterized protein n=2 Tax=Tatumella ptyseos TaxID=82987 RepID=A0A085JGS3_9GAMM|nr:hypothetical protein [Tatumella ptyseos]KFD19669.1 hypothetical protein GTPT_1600 [Tatumella ptyseos ATCC 33301]SQK75772.1 Uncharacterised protein [Tatumella ptyseos]
MKINELPADIQAIAAEALASGLRTEIDMMGEKRTEEAKKIAKTIRVAFEELFKG